MPGLLMHSPQRIVGAVFANLGFGTDPDTDPSGVWPIFDGREPDRPDNLIRVSGTRGRSFGYTQPDSEREEWNGILVYVRASVDNTAWQKVMQLALGLDCLTRYGVLLPLPDSGTPDTGTGTAGSARYEIASVLRTTEPVFIGRDVPEGKRVCYTVNALVSLRQCL